MTLSNQTIFLTGATAGFGRACAELFAEKGAKVVITGRRAERLAEIAARYPGNVHTLTFDVRDRTAVEAAIAGLPEAFSQISVLVNNAGLALGMDSADRCSMDDWEQMIDTNIKGVLYCTHALLPQMVARDRGHIVNLGSIAGNYPYPGGNVYGSTKAFIKQLSLNLRADLLGKNIRVTNIEPGMADTEFSLVRYKGDQTKADVTYEGMQSLTGDDIARTIEWCLVQPAHVNINRVEIMPTMQAFSPFAVYRKTAAE